MNLFKPKNYNYILDCCVAFCDGRISRKQLNEKLSDERISDRQFKHIMNQARNLSGTQIIKGGKNE